MLVIRSEQIKTFDKYAYQQFVDDMVIQLPADYPKETAGMSEADLRSMVEDGTSKAEKYNVTDVSDVERFLGCMLALGRDFDIDPQTDWAGEILFREDAGGTAKMDEIDEQMTFRLME